jgi:hypothetical protein
VLVLEKWSTVLVYVHVPSAIAEVEEHSRTRIGKSTADYDHEQGEARCAIARGAEIIIVPELPHCIFNPPSARVLWLEDWHAVEFRLSAPATILTSVDAGEKIRGRIGFYVGPVLIAEISLSLDVAGTENHQLEPAGVYSTVKPYQAVFVSYSHKDSAVVEQLEKAYRVLGIQYLRDIRSLRSGEQWNEALLAMIEKADIFQLMWSVASRQSKAVRREWKHALKQNRPFFIRPVYWETPMPKPPTALSALHFAYLELTEPQTTGVQPAAT